MHHTVPARMYFRSSVRPTPSTALNRRPLSTSVAEPCHGSYKSRIYFLRRSSTSGATAKGLSCSRSPESATTLFIFHSALKSSTGRP